MKIYEVDLKITGYVKKFLRRKKDTFFSQAVYVVADNSEMAYGIACSRLMSVQVADTIQVKNALGNNLTITVSKIEPRVSVSKKSMKELVGKLGQDDLKLWLDDLRKEQ